MSMHKIPLTPTEEAGLRAHGLQRDIGKPSQLADVFRQGVRWAKEEAAKICDEQAKEPECPERAQYCAEAIRAL